jgi:hypothetical protein
VAVQSKRVVLEQFVRVTAGPSRWPLMLLAAWWLCKRLPTVTTADRLAWCLAGAFPLAVLGSSLGHGATWFLALIVILLAAQRVVPVATEATILPWLGAATVLALANVRPIVEIAAGLSGAIVSGQSGNYPEALAIQPTPAHPLLVDSSSARYLYDYRLPEGALDFQFSARFPGVDATMDPLRPEDVYVVGALGMARLEEQRWCPPHLRTIRPLGSFTGAFPTHPRQVFIVTGVECQARLKARAEEGGSGPAAGRF